MRRCHIATAEMGEGRVRRATSIAGMGLIYALLKPRCGYGHFGLYWADSATGLWLSNAQSSASS